MVGIAQLVERRLVVADVAGSSPVTHPRQNRRSDHVRPAVSCVPGRGSAQRGGGCRGFKSRYSPQEEPQVGPRPTCGLLCPGPRLCPTWWQMSRVQVPLLTPRRTAGRTPSGLRSAVCRGRDSAQRGGRCRGFKSRYSPQEEPQAGPRPACGLLCPGPRLCPTWWRMSRVQVPLLTPRAEPQAGPVRPAVFCVSNRSTPDDACDPAPRWSRSLPCAGPFTRIGCFGGVRSPGSPEGGVLGPCQERAHGAPRRRTHDVRRTTQRRRAAGRLSRGPDAGRAQSAAAGHLGGRPVVHVPGVAARAGAPPGRLRHAGVTHRGSARSDHRDRHGQRRRVGAGLRGPWLLSADPTGHRVRPGARAGRRPVPRLRNPACDARRGHDPAGQQTSPACWAHDRRAAARTRCRCHAGQRWAGATHLHVWPVRLRQDLLPRAPARTSARRDQPPGGDSRPQLRPRPAGAPPRRRGARPGCALRRRPCRRGRLVQRPGRRARAAAEVRRPRSGQPGRGARASTRSGTARSTPCSSTSWSDRSRAGPCSPEPSSCWRPRTRATLQLGQRASNLGVLGWDIWDPAAPSLVEELREPTARCTVIDLGSLHTMQEQRIVAEATCDVVGVTADPATVRSSWSTRHTTSARPIPLTR